MHNHAKQFEFVIEKACVISDGYWHCLQSTLCIVVGDTWILYNHQIPAWSTDKDITMKYFVSILAWLIIKTIIVLHHQMRDISSFLKIKKTVVIFPALFLSRLICRFPTHNSSSK